MTMSLNRGNARGDLIPFPLRQNTTGVTGTAGVANKRSDIYVFQVPKGERYVVEPGSTFSAYVKDSSAEVGNNATIEVEVRDASGQDRHTVLGPMPYRMVTEFQDVDLKAKVNVPETLEVPERGKLVVIVTDDGTVSATNSYFEFKLFKTYRRPGR